MSDIVLLDTSIYLNILDVPGKNQDRGAVLDEFEMKLTNDDIDLPLAAVWETGNHITVLGNDGLRR